jgi:hypothetical protein
VIHQQDLKNVSSCTFGFCFNGESSLEEELRMMETLSRPAERERVQIVRKVFVGISESNSSSGVQSRMPCKANVILISE